MVPEVLKVGSFSMKTFRPGGLRFDDDTHRLCSGEVNDTLAVGKYICADVDQDGVPLGLEILFAGQVLSKQDLTSITVNLNRAAQPA